MIITEYMACSEITWGSKCERSLQQVFCVLFFYGAF